MVKLIWKKLVSERVDLYIDEIRVRNYKCFKGFIFVGSLMSLMVLIAGLILHKTVTFNREFFIILLYFLFMILACRIFIEKNIRYIIPIFYTALTPIMIMGIMMGTFLDRNEPSITIMVFMCVLPIFILDKPIRVFSYITVVAITYLICCYIAKDLSLFKTDLVDLIIFYILGVGVNFFTLHDRIESVENFVKYREKSELDLMTEIYNKSTGIDKIEKLIENKIYGAFIIIDVDNFKYINDNYGHLCGDEFLQSVSKVIKKCFKDEDIILRMGGDEFAIYSIGILDEKQCSEILDDFFSELKNIRIQLSGNYTFSASVGCSIYDETIEDFKNLYSNSDKCLYKAKKNGKGCYYIEKIKKQIP